MRLNFMLIDDNEIDLFVNQRYIEKVLGDVEIITFIRAKMALDYLRSLAERPNGDFIFVPDIIFLDINMPEMNGFGFLNEFSMLDNPVLANIKIYMLSSSTNLNDIIDAERHTSCNGFISKPLTSEVVSRLVNESKIQLRTDK